MQSVRLSIALVTRNRPHWLRQCLESWRAQDIQPFEIVVSDDSDHPLQSEARKIAEQFGARWLAGPQRGLYANRNRAFRAATGTHIMSADDDHTHPPGFVRTLINAVESEPEAIWTVSERCPKHPTAPLPVPGELRPNGTIGPPENPEDNAAIACGSTAYPRKVFDDGLCYDETYPFGGVWYLWGHQLRTAGFRIRYCPETFVWHHTESSQSRQDDLLWLRAQLECNLYVQAVHAFHVSPKPVTIARAIYNAGRLLLSGGKIEGNKRNVRLHLHQILRAFARAFQNDSL